MSSKLDDAELRSRLEAGPARYSLWMHAKTRKVVVVTATVLREEDLEPYVVYEEKAEAYRQLAGHETPPERCLPPLAFARPLSQWEELVDNGDGRQSPRFVPLFRRGARRSEASGEDSS